MMYLIEVKSRRATSHIADTLPTGVTARLCALMLLSFAVEVAPRLFETEEAAELLGHRARRTETVGRMIAVAVADRDRAKQHLLRRHVHERPDDAMHARPGFLRTGVEPAPARQKHQRMNIAAEIGPLAGAEPAIDGDEQGDRRVEELVIALVLVEPRREIVAVDGERAVKLHAMMLAPGSIRLPHRLRINRIFGILVSRIAARDCGGDLPLEFGQRRAGERVNLPRLQIAAGRRARRARDQVAHQFRIDRLIEKPAAGNPGIDGFKHIHGALNLQCRSELGSIGQPLINNKLDQPPQRSGGNCSSDTNSSCATRNDSPASFDKQFRPSHLMKASRTKQKWTPRTTLQLWLERLMLNSSKSRYVDGLWIGAFEDKKTAQQILTRLEAALALIKHYDRFRYDRIVRDLRRIWVTLLPTNIANFAYQIEACQIDSRYFLADTTTLEMIASTIVHEATHARLWRFGYDEALRSRIEAICIRREIAFVAKLPNSEQIR